jgi:hypothetical protein
MGRMQGRGLGEREGCNKERWATKKMQKMQGRREGDENYQRKGDEKDAEEKRKGTIRMQE